MGFSPTNTRFYERNEVGANINLVFVMKGNRSEADVSLLDHNDLSPISRSDGSDLIGQDQQQDEVEVNCYSTV